MRDEQSANVDRFAALACAKLGVGLPWRAAVGTIVVAHESQLSPQHVDIWIRSILQGCRKRRQGCDDPEQHPPNGNHGAVQESDREELLRRGASMMECGDGRGWMQWDWRRPGCLSTARLTADR